MTLHHSGQIFKHNLVSFIIQDCVNQRKAQFFILRYCLAATVFLSLMKAQVITLVRLVKLRQNLLLNKLLLRRYKHHSKASWTSFCRFWAYVIQAPKLKMCFEEKYMCVEEKFKFFVNYDKWLHQSRNLQYEALITHEMLCFSGLCQWTLPGKCI